MDAAVGNGSNQFAGEVQLESPFAEAMSVAMPASSLASPAAWALGLAPFADEEAIPVDRQFDRSIDEALSELRDEAFHEAVAFLAEETEEAVGDRFTGETALYGGERERFARSRLSPVQFEAEQYLASLEQGLQSLDGQGLGEDQLDEAMDRLDPQPGELTPAGEEFIGSLVKKAKSAVRTVAKVAKQAGKLALPLLGPVLNRLRKLIQPLLQRVLKFAIGKLPAPLQPAARGLAEKMFPAASAPTGAAAPQMAPAAPTDAVELADSFDLNLAEAIAWPERFDTEADQFAPSDFEGVPEIGELGELTEARSALIKRLQNAAAGQDLAPEIEQFVPVLLGALRAGISLAGRPRVVGFLAGYLSKMIGKWVGPEASGPLSRAIVDTGLKLASLEVPDQAEAEAANVAPVALASVIEDTVRRFAENETYLFEDEDLAQVAIAQAFSEAAATYFPQDQIRQELQLAPSLGGTFVTRRPHQLRSYAKYSRTPEIEISARAADGATGFGGGSLGGALRAAGGRFPLRARLHIYQLRPGSTVASMLRHDRRAFAPTGPFPLTPNAASLLLGEASLGVAVPARFLQNRNRVGAGQRVYVLEPLGQTLAGTADAGRRSRRIAPGRIWIAVDSAKSRITVGVYLSEAEAQSIAESMRSGRGHGELLRLLMSGFKTLGQAATEAEGPGGGIYEDGEEFEDFAGRAGARLPAGFKALLRRRVAAWALPALAEWLRGNSEAFLRAAAHPDPGVKLRIRLSNVPGLAKAVAGGEAPTLAALTAAMQGKPAATIMVSPGSGRR